MDWNDRKITLTSTIRIPGRRDMKYLTYAGVNPVRTEVDQGATNDIDLQLLEDRL